MIQLDVTIMGQAYRLACKKGEEKALQDAVDYLNSKVNQIR
ncbi:MAG: cell division protein ZapA, partial [Burkholderiales bacterium]|nr:cell division protein ZapA [Burkholderiales bacterium]